MVGKVQARTWLSGRQLDLFTLWNTLFPGWQNGHIIYLELDKPTRSMTYNEFREAALLRYNMDEEDIMSYYEQNVPFVTFIACPEDGVEEC